VPARRPRAEPAATVVDQRRSESKLSSRRLVYALARLRRAGELHSSKAVPPTLYVIAPIPDLWPRFPPSTRSGWPDGLSLPRSSRRNAPRGPNSSRSRNLRCAPIPRGLVQSFNARGRRGGFAAPAAVATGLCCGPRYAAIWHADAHQLTTSRGPRDEALRNSATPTGGSGRRIQAWGRQIRNPKFRGGGPKLRIKNSASCKIPVIPSEGVRRASRGIPRSRG